MGLGGPCPSILRSKRDVQNPLPEGEGDREAVERDCPRASRLWRTPSVASSGDTSPPGGGFSISLAESVRPGPLQCRISPAWLSAPGTPGRSDVDELRQAVVHYRALFMDLVAEPELAPRGFFRPAHSRS